MLNSIRLRPGVCTTVRLAVLLCRILEREPRNLGSGESASWRAAVCGDIQSSLAYVERKIAANTIYKVIVESKITI
jgi:hypothetical protein